MHVQSPHTNRPRIGEESERVLQRAGPNRTDRARAVMTIIYMDRDMRLAEPKNANQRIDWQAWCPNVRPGEIIDAPLTPVLYP